MVAFQVFDLAVSRRVFSICGTSTRGLALDEQHQTQGTFIPERVGIGFGIWSMLPIREVGRWRRFRLRAIDA